MESIISEVIAGAVGVVKQVYAVLGQGLGLAVVIMLLSWFSVERKTPVTWPRWKNMVAAQVAAAALTVGGHLVIPAMSYGPGWRGVGAALFFSALSGGAATPFHDYIARRYLPAAVLNPARMADEVKP